MTDIVPLDIKNKAQDLLEFINTMPQHPDDPNSVERAAFLHYLQKHIILKPHQTQKYTDNPEVVVDWSYDGNYGSPWLFFYVVFF